MEATEICLWPGGLLVEHAAIVARETGAKAHLAAMQTFRRIAVPGFDGVEVIEFGHAPAGRREMATRRAAVLVQFRHVQDISEEHPMLVKVSREDFLPKPGESIRLVNLISVHAENPRGRARKMLDEAMGFGGMPDGFIMHFGQLAGQRAQNNRRSVDRAMIGDVDFIAKIGNVPHRGFDEDVLVADKNDPDNAWRAQTRCLPWTRTQSHCLSRSMRMTERNFSRSRRTTSSVRSHEIDSNGPPPSSRLIPMS